MFKIFTSDPVTVPQSGAATISSALQLFTTAQNTLEKGIAQSKDEALTLELQIAELTATHTATLTDIARAETVNKNINTLLGK